MILPILGPFMRDADESAIRMSLQAKKLAEEAAEDPQDMAAETGAELASGDNGAASAVCTAKKA